MSEKQLGEVYVEIVVPRGRLADVVVLGPRTVEFLRQTVGEGHEYVNVIGTVDIAKSPVTGDLVAVRYDLGDRCVRLSLDPIRVVRNDRITVAPPTVMELLTNEPTVAKEIDRGELLR